jgi:hypothetical protein
MVVSIDGQLITPFLIKNWFQYFPDFRHERHIAWLLVALDVADHGFGFRAAEQRRGYLRILARELQGEPADRSSVALAESGDGAKEALVFGASGMPRGRAAIS